MRNSINIAEEKIDQLFALTKDLTAKDTDDLLHIYEVKERLVVCKKRHRTSKSAERDTLARFRTEHGLSGNKR